MWHTALKKQQREEEILLSLKKLDYLTTGQIQRLHNLGQERNAQRVMKNLSEYVSCFREGENIYYLNAKGRERVQCNKVRRKSPAALRAVMRNYIYLHYDCPETWKAEVRIGTEKLYVIADAVFTANNRFHIVEVDRTQQMRENRDRIEKYRQMIEAGVFPEPPIFIWVTTTPYRKEQLEKELEGLDAVVYLVDDLK